MGTTDAQRTLFFKLRQTKSRIAALQEGDMNSDHAKLVAEHLEVSEQDVVEMNRRLKGDVSLNTRVRDDNDFDELQDRLAAEGPNQEEMLVENDEREHRQEALRGALMTLDERERYVLEMRRLADEPRLLEVLALELGVSSERVRQIETLAFQKLCRATKRSLVVRRQGRASRSIGQTLVS
jgi:RNA polymerase sigma-32 factor